MLIHSSPLFQIYFGDSQDQLSKPYYSNLPDQPILSLDPFSQLKQRMQLKELFFLRQIHSDHGINVDAQSLLDVKPFKHEGDFLVTASSRVGVGIMTADCLPIVFHDKVRNVAAVTHAGWRGSVLGVAIKTVQRMQKLYGTQPENLTVFLGPSAKVCCYEVSADFKNNLEAFSYGDRVLQIRGDKTYFDVSLFNRMQLETLGIKKEAIHTDYNMCTMCSPSFCSHRRDPIGEKRQMTVVCLK